MEKLNRDEIYLICMKLDCESILRLLSTNKKLYKMNLKDMWIHKLDRFPNHKMKNYILLCQLEKFKEKFKFKKNIYEIYDSDKISLADIRMINPPKILNNLINLYHLDLSGNRLTEIPIIFNLLNLEIDSLHNISP